MRWNRSTAIALANETCKSCAGGGLRIVFRASTRPCGCVYRAIARIVLARYWLCAAFPRTGSDRRGEEFCADVCLIARRMLAAADYPFFVRYLLHRCHRPAAEERGDFFSRYYRIERRAGKAFAETEPYGLFPLDEYFGGVVRQHWKRERGSREIQCQSAVVRTGDPVQPSRGGRPRKGENNVLDSVHGAVREMRQAGGAVHDAAARSAERRGLHARAA